MSPPPSVRQISRDTLGEVPQWVDRLLPQLNRFMTQVVDLFSSNLDSQNLAAAFVDIQVTEGTAPQPFVAPLNGRKVRGVHVAKVAAIGTGGTPGAAPTASVFVLWDVATVDGKPGVAISNVFGLATGGKYLLTLKLEAQ